MAELYVQWDADKKTIVKGPQGNPGEGPGWYPYLQIGEIDNPRLQKHIVDLEPQRGVVIHMLEPTQPTWLERRMDGYGNLEDQLDMIFHDIERGRLNRRGSFYQFIKSVKDAHPKPLDGGS